MCVLMLLYFNYLSGNRVEAICPNQFCDGAIHLASSSRLLQWPMSRLHAYAIISFIIYSRALKCSYLARLP